MAKLNSSPEEGQNIDLLRRKFGAQNRAIAKSYAGLQEKILQLEQRISELMKENLDIKYENLRLAKAMASQSSSASSAELLAQQFVQIKKLLSTKYQEMEDIIANGFNLNDSANTSIEECGISLRSSIATRKKSQTRLSDCIDEVTEADSGLEIARSSDRISTSRSSDSINGSYSSHSPWRISDSPNSLSQEAHVEEPSIKPDTRKSPVPDENNVGLKPVELSPFALTPSPPRQPPRKSVGRKPKMNSNKSQKKLANDSLARKPLGIKSPNKVITKSPLGTKTSASLKNTAVADQEIRRRSRGKEVNYALPSLRVKMRRPTEKMTDAIPEGEKEN